MKLSDWVTQSLAEKRLLSRFPPSWDEMERVFARRAVLERLVGFEFDGIPLGNGVLEKASGRNIENAIGVTSVPLGVAGPLRIRGSFARGDYFLPLSTSEGALVASINRGCKAILESGGAVVESFVRGATRGPVFRVESISQGRGFAEFLDSHFPAIKKVAEATSQHLTLKSFSIAGTGKYRFVRFVFDTQEAMGLNMVTIATGAIVRFLEKKIGVRCIDLSGNFCVDKKPAWQNFVNNRGIPVRAEVTLSAPAIRQIVKTDAASLYETWLAKCMIGSAMSGSMGFNAQFANVVAALFLATGQDLGQVTEGSLGITTTEVVEGRTKSKKDGLYISVYLPDLMVGTVGGGTGLPSQQAALRFLGLGYGRPGEARVLAEIVGSAVLAGEISLLSSLAEGSLSRAHKRLGRGRE